jgi:hypothetical protein
MPTSHYCNGKWRDGPVSACPRHQKLSKKLTNVHRGVGEPGGQGGTKAPKTGGSDTGSSDSSSPETEPSGGSGSRSKES